MAQSTTRRINIFINGQYVENTYKGIQQSMQKARNELSRMEIDTKQYIQQTKKIKQLQGHLDRHMGAQGKIARGWKRIRQEGQRPYPAHSRICR